MTFEEVFTIEHLYECAKKCCKGVRWKASTQVFEALLMKNVVELHNQLMSGTFKSRGFHEFSITERGKTRHIKSVHITERVVQKCFCDYCLAPSFRKSFIYDSGATLPGKGTHFAIRRLKVHLHKYARQYGNEGYVLTFDVAKFFDTIDHSTLLNIVRNKLQDDKLYSLFKYLVDQFGPIGLGLGSQISQLCALIYLDSLDHKMKDELGIKYYGRYMDDGYIICDDKKKLVQYYNTIEEHLQTLKLRLNRKKTQIVKLSSGFTILKRRFYLKPTGRLIVKPYKRNILRYKRKYRRLLKRNATPEVLATLTATFVGYLKEFHYVDRYTSKL